MSVLVLVCCVICLCVLLQRAKEMVLELLAEKDIQVT